MLDVGCGTGQTTRDAARAASAGSALGVDLSSRMLDHARRRATEEGVTNVTFAQADAQIHPFEPGAYDVAISRTAAMFFGDHVAAFSNIGRALRSGGRLVLVTWQPLPGNEWIREISGALAAGRDLPAPPPDAPAPSRSPTRTAFAPCSPAPGSPTSSSRGRPRACGSATTPTTPTASCSA